MTDRATTTALAVTQKSVGHAWDGSQGSWDPNFLPRKGIVVHTMVGTAEGADARFANPANCVSANYGILETGEIWQWVQENQVAYHCGNYRPKSGFIANNQEWIGIEFEDLGQPFGTRPDIQYSIGGKLIADICKAWDIPCDRSHIIGHKETPYATGCPDGLDVDRLVREAQGVLNPPPPATPTPTPTTTYNNDPAVELRSQQLLALAQFLGVDVTSDAIINKIKQLQTALQLKTTASENIDTSAPSSNPNPSSTPTPNTASTTPSSVPTPPSSPIGPSGQAPITPDEVKTANVLLSLWSKFISFLGSGG